MYKVTHTTEIYLYNVTQHYNLSYKTIRSASISTHSRTVTYQQHNAHHRSQEKPQNPKHNTILTHNASLIEHCALRIYYLDKIYLFRLLSYLYTLVHVQYYVYHFNTCQQLLVKSVRNTYKL